jgi:hypothetical protein
MKELFQSYRKNYPNELSLLIEALKADEYFDISHFFKAMQIDEKYLFQLISRHKIIGYVFRILSTHLSEQTKGKITIQYKEHSHHTLKFVRQLILVSQKLDNWDLPYIAFKGPVLSQMLYNDPLVKNSVDLDFWVPLDHLETCHKALNEAGYRRVKPSHLTPKQQEKNYSISHHYTYVHQTDRVVIELHWNITNPFSLLPLTFQEAYNSHIHVNLHNHKIKTLSYVHYLLYLAVHGSIHRWSRLTWLKDFSELLKLSTEKQQEEVFRMAKKLQLEKPVKQAFWLAYTIFDISLRDMILKKHPVKRSFFYIDPFKSLNKSTNRLSKEKLPGLFYKWHIRQNSKYRFSLFFRLRTHFTDWEIIKLPDKLFFLYYLLRPFFLVFRGIKSLLRRN